MVSQVQSTITSASVPKAQPVAYQSTASGTVITTSQAVPASNR